MSTRTKRQKLDLLCHWSRSGELEVSDSRHQNWYSIGHERGTLTCTCPDFFYRGRSRGHCKHTIEGASFLNSHAPTTPAQQRFSNVTFCDTLRTVLRMCDEMDMDERAVAPGETRLEALYR
jgi:hypothetical protein